MLALSKLCFTGFEVNVKMALKYPIHFKWQVIQALMLVKHLTLHWPKQPFLL